MCIEIFSSATLYGLSNDQSDECKNRYTSLNEADWLKWPFFGPSEREGICRSLLGQSYKMTPEMTVANFCGYTF